MDFIPERGEKSILLCGCHDGAPYNSWYLLSPAGDSLKPCPNISTDFGEFGCSYDNSVMVGRYLYMIGGSSYTKPRLLSNQIHCIDVFDSKSVKRSFTLPFYCSRSSFAVSGEKIYIFRKYEFGFCSDSKGYESLDPEKWAYVFDTEKGDGCFLDLPLWLSIYPYGCVSFATSLSCIGPEPNVFVYAVENMIFYDFGMWRLYDMQVFPRFLDEGRIVIASVVSAAGILYYLSYKCEIENTKPILTGFDFKKGENMFDLEVDSLGLGLGYSLAEAGPRSFLLALSNSKLCWIDAGSEAFFCTVMQITYSPFPELDILKKRKFELPISSVACCHSIGDVPNPNLMINSEKLQKVAMAVREKEEISGSTSPMIRFRNKCSMTLSRPDLGLKSLVSNSA